MRARLLVEGAEACQACTASRSQSRPWSDLGGSAGRGQGVAGSM